jgi:hypothetical protein
MNQLVELAIARGHLLTVLLVVLAMLAAGVFRYVRTSRLQRTGVFEPGYSPPSHQSQRQPLRGGSVARPRWPLMRAMVWGSSM